MPTRDACLPDAYCSSPNLAPLCLPHVKADLAESGGAVDQELAVGVRVAATENLQGADARVHIERDLIGFPAD
jgi:hypothetical protein